MNRSTVVVFAAGVLSGGIAMAIIHRRGVSESVPPSSLRSEPRPASSGEVVMGASRTGTPDLRAALRSALEARNDRKALSLLRDLVLSGDDVGLTGFLVEMLALSPKGGFF